MNLRTVFLALLVSLALVPAAVVAEDYSVHPSLARGFSASSAFEVNLYDSVNLFNGNLILTLPIGPTYSVGGHLSYGFDLHYNSFVWDHRRISCLINGQLRELGLPVPDATDHRPAQLTQSQDFLGAGRSNAGLGWALGFGRLFGDGRIGITGRWTYMTPDGGIRELGSRLHPDPYGGVPTPGVFYSNDSTYLRLKHFSGAGAAACRSPQGLARGECAQLELPSGEVHEFVDHGGDHAGQHIPDWRFVRKMDRFGHWMNLEWRAADGAEPEQWHVTDSLGRFHRVVFAGSQGAFSQIDFLELAGPGGQQLTVDLVHTTRSIDRQTWSEGCDQPQGTTIAVPLLEEIRLPEGAVIQAAYNLTDSLQDVLSGAIRRFRLATGGELRWTYQQVGLRLGMPTLDGDEPYTSQFSIATKKVLDGVNPDADNTWTYDWQTITHPSQLPCHYRVTVTDPEQGVSDNFFDTQELDGWSHGLPFSRCEEAGNPHGFLSQRQYDRNGTLLRSTYLVYETDGSGFSSSNNRQQKQVLVYHDDGGRWVAQELSDFDGLGHYRTVTRSASSDFEATPTLAVTTTFNDGRGTLTFDPTQPGVLGGDFTMLEPQEPWILETFTRIATSSAGQTFIEDSCFDPETGFLRRRRQLAGTSPGPGDLVQEFETWEGQNDPDHIAGEILALSWFGGDGASLGSASPCNLALPSPSYRVELEYQNGVISGSHSVDGSGRVVLTHFRAGIDPNTGLVSWVEDSAGVETSFGYDGLLRRSYWTTPDGARNEVVYRLPGATPGATTGAEVEMRVCPNGAVGCPNSQLLVRSELRFDGFGRQTFEQARRPADTSNGYRLANRTQAYRQIGWMTEESTWHWQGDTPAGRTLYTDFDTFGRPGRTVLPDGKEILTTYTGDRLQRVLTRVASGEQSGQVVEQASANFSVLDGLGRLRSVCQGANESAGAASCGGGVKAAYDYDPAGRLTRVCLEPNGSACGQTRTFTFDGRGLLTSASHPELAGRLERFEYDAAGNMTRRAVRQGGNDRMVRLYRYDPARRLTWVGYPTESGDLRPLIETFYHGMDALAAQGSERAEGKLYQRRRHNWLAPRVHPDNVDDADELDYVLTETFRYRGLDGALSERQVRLGLDHRLVGFEALREVNELGRPSATIYPDCRYLHCPGGGEPDRTVRYGYRQDVLSSVGEGGSSTSLATIRYWPSGLVHQVLHGNGVTYTQTQDPSQMQRPAEISTDRGWTTGVYQYDTEGNIAKIGGDSYSYDRLSRLVAAKLENGNDDGTQSATWDPVGNLQTLATSHFWGTVQLNPDTGTNRSGLYAYDLAGNATSWSRSGVEARARFDVLDQMKELAVGNEQSGALVVSERQFFLYDADNERFATLRCTGGCEDAEDFDLTLTPRDEDGRVLRVATWRLDQGTTAWHRDYVYRGATLLATQSPGTVGPNLLHLHPDHLGTPRQMTTASGSSYALRRYFPFGQEFPEPMYDDVTLDFTGHERDGHFLDYFHARYYSPVNGRFLSPDPVGGDPAIAQSWNRYAYVRGNPLKYLDPDGRTTTVFVRSNEGPNFGHAAVRIQRDGMYDITVDFGPYEGLSHMPGNGKGVLRFHRDFDAYVADQTKNNPALAKVYDTSAEFEQALLEQFDELKGPLGSRIEDGNDEDGMVQYRTREDYEVRSNNCLTTVIDALSSAAAANGGMTGSPSLDRNLRDLYQGAHKPATVYGRFDAERKASGPAARDAHVIVFDQLPSPGATPDN
ncbi:MAG TPA: RHS repeat-associated core domain-containing protein [Thermoanaerobaculia bacterium]|nr:RHS repeat-associated core domain-containing protein [Thermoanaerobaculia bacterium]